MYTVVMKVTFPVINVSLVFLGLLDQWLLEKKFTEEEALSNSYDMLSAGIDTVN